MTSIHQIVARAKLWSKNVGKLLILRWAKIELWFWRQVGEKVDGGENIDE
jgi:hypothetical protein